MNMLNPIINVSLARTIVQLPDSYQIALDFDAYMRYYAQFPKFFLCDSQSFFGIWKLVFAESSFSYV
jgi:hypothetical protein